MKYFYIAVQIEESGKYYAYAHKVSISDNLVAVLRGIANLHTANICPTKKQAAATVAHWNACHKANGRYLFDSPNF